MNSENTNQPVGMGTSPMAGGQPPITPMPAPAKNGIGGVIALVVIVLALLAGGYFLMQKMKSDSMPVPTTMPVGQKNPAGAEDQAAVDPNTVQGTSSDLSDIEKDIDSTDLDTLSADLNAI